MPFFFSSSVSASSSPVGDEQNRLNVNNSKNNPKKLIVQPSDLAPLTNKTLQNRGSLMSSFDVKTKPLKCPQCDMIFQGNKQLLNHQRKFCLNSGYDSLNNLIQKEVHPTMARETFKKMDKSSKDHERTVQQINQPINKSAKKSMKKYGEYSLSNLKPHSEYNLNLYEDMKEIYKHKETGKDLRPYIGGATMKVREDSSIGMHSARQNHNDQSYHSPPSGDKNSPKQHFDFENSKSGSAFSYRLNNDQSLRQPLKGNDYSSNGLQSLLQKHTDAERGAKYEKSSNPNLEEQDLILIRFKDNPASKKFKEEFSILEKSNASIANMTEDEKISYAKAKLDQLQSIQRLYFQNGGQEKTFSHNIDKMIKFYESLLEKTKRGDSKSEVETQLSLASRPQTPIIKLKDLNSDRLENQHHYNKNRQQQSSSRAIVEKSSKKQQSHQQNQAHEYMSPPRSTMVDPQKHMSHQYRHFLQQQQMMITNSQQNQISSEFHRMKMMEDLLKMKSQDNQKLIEALVAQQRTSKESSSDQSQPKSNLSQNELRLALQSDPAASSEDKILKMLQAEELDEINLLAKLPVALQDEKLQSLKKNTETRYRMEKEILKQKLERMNWQEKVQVYEEERELNNGDWVGGKRKEVIRNQMGQYLNSFQHEFKAPAHE